MAAPFVVALVAAGALARTRFAGLAVLAGILVCVHLTTGLDLFPLTSTRRIVLLALTAGLIGASVDLVRGGRAAHAWPAGLANALAAAWVLQPALAHRDLAPALILGGGLAAFCALLGWGFDRLAGRPVRAGCAALGTGLAAGGAAIAGASASLGQIGLAGGVAAGGYLLVRMLRGGAIDAGRTLTAPAGLTSALVAAAAVALASLPWTALPVIAVIPLAAGAPLGARLPAWLETVVHGALAVAIAAGAVAIAWTSGTGSSRLLY